jgi:SAM-dependent methyltransferase
MTNRIDSGYVRDSFSGGSTLRAYSDAVESVGLWESERLFCEKYIARDARLLDVGCGAGRTTFGLYRLGYRDIEGLDITPAAEKSSGLCS